MGSRDDREAGFVEFVSARYATLVRSAYLLVGDRMLAEDLVQQALLTTFRRWNHLVRVGSAEAYTRQCMVRLAGRWWRRRWTGEVSTGVLPETAGGDHAARVDTARTVRQALGRLPWAQRSVLVMRYFEDRPDAEIAQVLGCSLGTVRSRAARGIGALRAVGLLSEQTQTTGGVDHA